MPRPNATRSVESEANLARRIARERDARGLSYEALAKLMTDVGCPIQGSAIFKIEKGDPPRRITVDELVAFGLVFGVAPEDLLVPMELIEQRHAHELIEKLSGVSTQVEDLATDCYRAALELLRLSRSNRDLYEYVSNHLAHRLMALPPRTTPADASSEVHAARSVDKKAADFLEDLFAIATAQVGAEIANLPDSEISWLMDRLVDKERTDDNG